MNEQELNKKLAEEFLKWTSVEIVDHGYAKFIKGYDAKKQLVLVRLLTDSLDACFKWLVPKVENLRGYERKIQVSLVSGWGDTSGDYGVEITEMGKRLVLEFNQNPALALCKAIEKLIDELP